MFTILTEKWEKNLSMKILLLGRIKRVTEVIKNEFIITLSDVGLYVFLWYYPEVWI